MAIKAIIIDDEKRARNVLQTLLSKYCPDIEVVASCADVPRGVININQLRPDVVFLDIEMPEYSGFELLSFFRTVDFEIIFVTAYNEYALKAFEVSAVDYLLKPLQIDKLENAVEKLKSKLDASSMQERLEALRDNLAKTKIRKIALPMYDGLHFVQLEALAMLEAKGSYTEIHFTEEGQKSILVSRRLGYFENLLEDNEQFLRVHRSSLVNLRFVKKYSRQESLLVLDNGAVVNVARERKKQVEQSLGNRM